MLKALGRRIRMLVRGGRFERDLDEEMRLHVEMREERLRAAGAPADQARQAARRRFGPQLRLREESVDAWGWRWLERLQHDTRLGTRVLLKQPGFAALAVVTVGIGIGAMTGIYSLSHFLFDQQVAGARRSGELARINMHYAESRSNRNWAGYVHYEELRERQSVFTDLAHYFRFETVFSDGRISEEVTVESVSGSYFAVLGLSPALGRMLTPDDDHDAAELVAMISEPLWRARFGGDPLVLDRRVSLNGIPVRIVGVASRGFVGVDLDYLSAPGFWVSLHFPVQAPSLRSIPRSEFLRRSVQNSGPTIARLRPGIALQAAEGQLNGLIPSLSNSDRVRRVTVTPISQARISTDVRRTSAGRLAIFTIVSTLVLLGACFNVANFLMTRAAARRREFAVRLSLGATRARIVHQLLVEALLLAVAAGVTGVAIGAALLRMSGRTLGAFLGIPSAVDVGVNDTVLGIAVLLVIAAALLFGAIPAVFASRRDPAADLKNPTPDWTWAGVQVSPRQVLLAAQVAASIVLAVTAGLYAQSFYHVATIDPGFPTDRLIVGRVIYRSITSEEGRRSFTGTLLERLGRHPQVEHATIGPGAPFSVGPASVSSQESPGTVDAALALAAPGFFQAMGIQVVAGRELDGSEADAREAAVINSVLADALWPQQSALGRTFQRDSVKRTVVGVAAFDRCHGLLSRGGPCVWEPVTFSGTQAWIRIRVRGDDAAFIPVLRQLVRDAHPEVALADLAPMDEHMARLTTNQRVSAILSGVLAAIGVSLVVIGCFSLFASMVKDSARELAIRLALGATPRSLVAKVVLRGLGLVVSGTLVGAVASIFVRRRVADQLFEIGSSDVTALVVTVAAIMSAALIATYVPARLALRKEPAPVLRES
jgi:predicted permease